MDQERPKYPRVTQAQLQIWLADPTTKKYFTCLSWHVEQNKEYFGKGLHVTTDANEVLSSSHSILGERNGLSQAIDYTEVFTRHDMLEPESEKQLEGEFTDGA